MRVAEMIEQTEVEGPGMRCAVWFQGCQIRCAHCCNPEFFSREGGKERSPENLVHHIKYLPIEGVTLLGGEPLEQKDLGQFLARLKNETPLGVILFTGYTWPQLQTPAKQALVSLCDLVIAGPYLAEQQSEKRRWIGSDNQTVHFITPRYQQLLTPWPAYRREIELHLSHDSLFINGMPLGYDWLE